MSERRRTLTEELNSVLRAHALHAPEPSRVIEAVLADASARPAPRPRRRPGWLKHPENLAAGAAAAVVVVGLVAGGAFALRSNGGSSEKAASSAAGIATSTGDAAGGAAAPRAAGSASPSEGLGYGGASGVPVPEMSGQLALTCPGGVAALSSTVTSLPDYDVDASYCGATSDAPAGSFVQVVTRELPKSRILATLLRPAQGLQVDYVAAADNKIIIRAQSVGGSPSAQAPSAQVPPAQAPAVPSRATPSAGVPSPTAQNPAAAASNALYPSGSDSSPAAALGDVRDLTFAVDSAVVTFTPTSDQVVAKPCAKAAVAATMQARSATSAAITVVNESASPCALTGYPDVRGKLGAATQVLAGRAGGVLTSAVPPVVVVQPGGQATALLELSTTEAACGPGELTVSLPAIGPVLTLTNDYGLCQLQVHPFAAGTTGSSG